MGGSGGVIALVVGVLLVAGLIGAFVFGARRKEQEPPPPLGPEGSTGTPAGAGQTRSGGGSDHSSSGPGGGER